MSHITKGYDPGTRKRCVNPDWHRGRKVRIVNCPFGYKGKVATITQVDERYVYVRIKLTKGPIRADKDWDAVAYPPENLCLIDSPDQEGETRAAA